MRKHNGKQLPEFYKRMGWTNTRNWDAVFVITRKTMRAKLLTMGFIYLVPVFMNILGLDIFKWNY